MDLFSQEEVKEEGKALLLIRKLRTGAKWPLTAQPKLNLSTELRPLYVMMAPLPPLLGNGVRQRIRSERYIGG